MKTFEIADCNVLPTLLKVRLVLNSKSSSENSLSCTSAEVLMGICTDFGRPPSLPGRPLLLGPRCSKDALRLSVKRLDGFDLGSLQRQFSKG